MGRCEQRPLASIACDLALSCPPPPALSLTAAASYRVNVLRCMASPSSRTALPLPMLHWRAFQASWSSTDAQGLRPQTPTLSARDGRVLPSWATSALVLRHSSGRTAAASGSRFPAVEHRRTSCRGHQRAAETHFRLPATNAATPPKQPYVSTLFSPCPRRHITRIHAWPNPVAPDCRGWQRQHGRATQRDTHAKVRVAADEAHRQVMRLGSVFVQTSLDPHPSLPGRALCEPSTGRQLSFPGDSAMCFRPRVWHQ